MERVNRVITSMLSKLSEPIEHSDWAKVLNRVEFAINNSVNQSTQETPSDLLFGVRQRGEDVDWLGEYLDDKHCERKDLINIRESAAAAITKSQNKSIDYHNLKHKPAKVFQEGDFVVMNNVDVTVGKNKKLLAKFKGPYVIHKVLPND